MQQSNYQKKHLTGIKNILANLPSSADATLKEFVRQFFEKMPVSDLEKLSPDYAVAMATSAYRFMEKRDGHEPKIRIFQPHKKQHGYDNKYTVIELLNDDMPFLVDSLTAELTRQGFTIKETIHPIFKVAREAGKLKAINGGSARLESFIHFEISPLPEGQSEESLTKDLEGVLAHIRASVEDWKAITDKAEEHTKRLDAAKGFDEQSKAEVKDFLRWLVARNFVFLGYAEYNFYDSKGREALSVVPGSRLGILKIEGEDEPRGLEAMSPEHRHLLLVPQLIEITKSNRRSLVHRPVPMDYIGLKRFDAKGNVIGEARFLGLFTSNVYYQSTDIIPFARQKVRDVLDFSGFDPISHDGKSLKAILEFLPRDELFQMSPDALLEVSMGILALEAKPGVRVFVRNDAFERFVSLMVFVPRERFSTDLRRQIQAIVEKAFNGTSASFSTQITEAPLARLHLIVKTTPGQIPQVDLSAIEHEIAKCAYLWSDLLHDALMAKHGEHKTEKWQRAYANAFPQHYISRYDAPAAVFDIQKAEEAIASGGLVLDLFRVRAEGTASVHLKIYNPDKEIALSDILPLLENAGFRAVEEHPFLISPHGYSNQVWIRDFTLQAADGHAIMLSQVKPLVEDVLLNAWKGEIENDRFNALVLKSSTLSWRQVKLLRAIAKYLKQIGFTYSQSAIEQALGAHPQIAADIVALFEARFDPAAKNRDTKQDELKKKIEAALADVSNAGEDKILRRYADVVMATLRTNFYQLERDGAHKPVLSFKLDSKQVPDLPEPKPFAEIFVYSPRVEGIHLRGGRVARGGLRWSDRPEDFRTEVLGLMKAQMVKNAVIVPVGSKGGFVLKRATASREEFMKEGIACYKAYLSGLLDITDNIVKGKITPPARVVRHDGDDPYLVVAADKGTATFSDTANEISAEYNFWLGDAFASGGSAGYDHKEMGITARGAWISVVRHFREMGKDIAKEDFTVAGIGDMSGDVFGNGMLLSERIRLLAAFNHVHIFIDPNPDAKKSFAERKRLYNLPRSSWKDYNASLISKGGGVFERSAKTITLSKEAQAALGVSKATLTPDEVIRAILLAPVELLWNGGIGTYVKAEDESHEAVGDRTNNAVRVNGRELRCKVAGEGGNLGFTQKGRIEFARHGGRINTDAIDNSAGVDCSDHEVNIKIAFSQEIAAGKLTIKKRDALLESMTDEVAELVLKDNILQTQAISVAEQQGTRLLESQKRLIHGLEQSGLLKREIEFLPSDKQIADLKAAGKGLTRPSLAVLLAYSKMALYKELLESSLPDEEYFLADLKRYFPRAMREPFASAIAKHPLRREITATVVTNSIVNRAGITFAFDMAEDIGASVRDIAAAYAIVRNAFSLRDVWVELEQLGGTLGPQTESGMQIAINRFLRRTVVWMLRNLASPLDIAAVSAEITPAVAAIQKQAVKIMTEAMREEAERSEKHLAEQGVPAKLAATMAALPLMTAAPDIISVAHKNKTDLAVTAQTYFAIASHLQLDWLRHGAEDLNAATQWERLAAYALANSLADEHRRLTDLAVQHGKGFEHWLEAHKDEITHFRHFVKSMKAGDMPDLARLTVALGHLRLLISH